MDDRKKKSNGSSDSEVSTGEMQMKDLIQVRQRGIVEIGPAVSSPIPTYEMVKDIGKLEEKLKATKEENAQLTAKLDALQKENLHLTQTVRSLTDSQEKLKNDLQDVMQEKEKLRAEMEERTSKFNSENEKLERNLDSLKEELGKVEAENKALTEMVDLIKHENAQLKEDMEKLQKEHGEKLEKVETENAQLKEEMGKLKKEHSEIRDKLEKKEAGLALGQVVWLLEKEINKYVLPGINMGKIKVLNRIEKWLDTNSQTKEGKAAEDRWNKLRKELKWDDEKHKDALKILKKLRLEHAHPPDVDLQEAKKQLNDCDDVGDFDKDSCHEIIDMITKARSLNQQKK